MRSENVDDVHPNDHCQRMTLRVTESESLRIRRRQRSFWRGEERHVDGDDVLYVYGALRRRRHAYGGDTATEPPCLWLF